MADPLHALRKENALLLAEIQRLKRRSVDVRKL